MRLPDVFKASCKNVLKTSSRHIQRHLAKTFSRRLQNAFKTLCKDVFKTFSRRFQVNTCSRRFQGAFKTHSTRFFDVLGRRSSTERFAWATRLRGLCSGYKFSKSELSGYTKTFREVFLKHFNELLLQIKIILLKPGIRKDVVSLIKKSMNKSSSKNVFLRF